MKTKLERIADKSAHEPKPEFTSLYHLINKELLMQCHRELDGSKAVGIDEVTKKEYGENLEQNIEGLVAAAIAPGVHSEKQWETAPAGDCKLRGQNSPAGFEEDT